MPAVMAGAGTVSLIVLGAIAVGAMLLGILFGQLTKRVPNGDGGVYAYSRHEFGDFAGYLVGWCYWIQSWAVDTEAALESILATVRPLHPAVDVRAGVVEGHPAPVLVDASRSADLLVVGSRGYGEFAGMLLGSVSEHCVSNARCPVLVFREGR